jgi:hypothetical protein
MPVYSYFLFPFLQTKVRDGKTVSTRILPGRSRVMDDINQNLLRLFKVQRDFLCDPFVRQSRTVTELDSLLSYYYINALKH